MCSSPALANGQLYLRLKNGVGCWDIAEHRPYLGRVEVKGAQLVVQIERADGGLAVEGGSDGAIQGLTVIDALGAARPAKARLAGNTLAVDVGDTPFPVDLSYETGNLSAKNGPLAPFHWRSPRLALNRCDGNVLTLDFRGQRQPDPSAWNNAKLYEIAGAKATDAEGRRRDRSGRGRQVRRRRGLRPK